MLLPWGATTVVGHLVAQWRSVGATQIGPVCAADHEAIHAELDRIGFARGERILNPEPARGMFSSIQCAAQWTGWNPALTHWALALGDQPHLSMETLRSLIEFSAGNPGNICQPSRAGRARHPVLLPQRFFRELASSSCGTLKEFLTAHRESARWIELSDAGLDFDLDTPSDYETARQKFIGKGAQSGFPLPSTGRGPG
jgi:CTP:molybdopterin cytidylyltransferase MocA